MSQFCSVLLVVALAVISTLPWTDATDATEANAAQSSAPLSSASGDAASTSSAVAASSPLSLLWSSGEEVEQQWSAQAERDAVAAGSTLLRRQPLVLRLPSFLTSDEGAQILRAAEDAGFNARTELHPAFARLPNEHPLRAAITERAAALAGVSSSHVEFGPVLRLEVGESYDDHHDCHPSMAHRALSLLAFLDAPAAGVGGAQQQAAGGEVVFPKLDELVVEPQAGAALLWRNVPPDALPNEYDADTLYAIEAPLHARMHVLTLWIGAEAMRPFLLPRLEGKDVDATLEAALRVAQGRESQALPRLAAGEVNLLEVPSRDVQLAWLAPITGVGLLRFQPLFPHSDFLALRVADLLPLGERQAVLRRLSQATWHEQARESGRRCAHAWIFDSDTQTQMASRIRELVGDPSLPLERIETNLVTRYRPGQFVAPFYDARADLPPDRILSVHVVLSSHADETSGARMHFSEMTTRFRLTPGSAFVFRNAHPNATVFDSQAKHAIEAPMRGTLVIWNCFVLSEQELLRRKGKK